MSMDNDYNGNRTPGAHSQRPPAGTAPASAGTVPPAAPQGDGNSPSAYSTRAGTAAPSQDRSDPSCAR